MSASAAEVEDDLSSVIGKSFSGVEEEDDAPFESDAKFDYDLRFQDKIMALMIRDAAFVRKTNGLIIPDYFEDAATATLVNLVQEYWARYNTLPSAVSMSQVIKDGFVSGKIRSDLRGEVVKKFKAVIREKGSLSDVSDRDFVADKVAEFARHQAIYKAIIQSAEWLEKGKFDKIAEAVNKASKVGVNEAMECFDYFKEIEKRSRDRKDKVAGIKPPQGITTGIRKLDKMLYHLGWGKKELSVILGGAKAGKSTGLLFFAKNAALDGKNVLYITLEMSTEIASSRVDASISEVEMKELEKSIAEVEEKVKKAGDKAGLFYMTEYPTGSFTPAMLDRLLESHAAEGRKFEMVVIDYLDLMQPDFRTTDAIENSKGVYVGVRAIAQQNDIAILSATQSNREGFKSITAKAEHVSDDFNKVRIADLIISINATEDEIARGEARLYFAASRNQAGSVMIQIRRELEKMIFIKSVIGVI